MNFIENATRNRIQQSAKDGFIFVNGKVVKPSYKVKSDDVVTISYRHPRREYVLEPEDLPIDIVYEDDDIIIVNKEAGMVVHPGFGNYEGTLVHALAFHFNDLPSSGDLTRPGLVHRLDKNTSGIMVVAKNQSAMTIMGNKFAARELDRRYIALVWGDLNDKEGKITGNIFRHHKNRKIMDVSNDEDIGKHAVTNWKVLERFGYTTLIECKLETGRTHQIRAHFRSIGHPLFNDPDYGGDKILKGTSFTKYKQFIQNCFSLCDRQALHAKHLSFVHPTNNKEMIFDKDPPEDFSSLLDKWREYVKHQN